MITVRPASERGVTKFGWLDSRHTFSFGDYRDPKHVHFRTLRVINDDVVGAGGGFDTHPHRDMEIITVMLEGELVHRDSMGHQESLKPGEVQVMTAGSGLLHSEHNGSASEPAHLIQTWIFPEAKGLTPSYAQREFPVGARRDRLVRVAGKGNGDGALPINQDAALYLSRLTAGGTATHTLAPGRGAWVHVAAGEATVNGTTLRAGDGAAIEDEATITLNGVAPETDVLLFDLA
ncbi:MAG TPA: pirin family protein [Phycisphaerales bacterium]|nr:pirin family protein [Phycisphaerales bacterium]